MSTPTMKELIAKATPGTWQTNLSEDERSSLDTLVCAVGGKIIAECHVQYTSTKRYVEIEANAQIIARCNPATMAKVVEALEWLSMDEHSTHSRKLATEALNLLDGKPSQ